MRVGITLAVGLLLLLTTSPSVASAQRVASAPTPRDASGQRGFYVRVGQGSGLPGAERMRDYVAGALEAIDGMRVAPTDQSPAESDAIVRTTERIGLTVDWRVGLANGNTRQITVTVWDHRHVTLYGSWVGSIDLQDPTSDVGVAVAVRVSFILEDGLPAVLAAAPPLPDPDHPSVAPLPPVSGAPDITLIEP